MIDFISISLKGSISILGVSLCMGKEAVLERLSSFQTATSHSTILCNNCIINDVLPSVNLRFKIDEASNKVIGIKVWNNCKTKNDCDNLYDYFKDVLYDFNLNSEKDKANVTHKIFTNTLHYIELHKQYGIDETDSNGNLQKHIDLYPFYLEIEGTLFIADDMKVLRTVLSDMYLSDNTLEKNEKSKRKRSHLIAASLLIVVLISILFLCFRNSILHSHVGKYVYFEVWRSGYRLHVDRDCPNFGKNGQVQYIETARLKDCWSFCPKCVTDDDAEYLEGIMRNNGDTTSINYWIVLPMFYQMHNTT